MLKKILSITTLLVVLVSCSKADNNFIIDNGEQQKPIETVTPTAVNDTYNTSKNENLILKDLLSNDLGIDENTSFEIITTDLKGSISNNSDGSYTYTPSDSFTGTDSFQYQLCSASTSEDCTIATVTITVVDLSTTTFNIPTELQNYYSTITYTTDANALYDKLHDLTTNKHTNILSYSQRHPYLLKADEDLTNSANVILMYTGESRNKSYRQTSGSYSGKFNTEHVYPQSLFKGGETVKGDLHHLRYCDGAVNTSRSNRTYVAGNGDAGIVGGKYYPGDEWKGDVARMILYLNVRYDESIETMGDLNLFLQWNVEDPISDLEIQRNDVIEDAQGNRNPFIDNPYLVTLIWGGTNALNKWK